MRIALEELPVEHRRVGRRRLTDGLGHPRMSAMSPPIRTCTVIVPIFVVRKVAMSAISCGTIVRRDAASISGLMWTSAAPFRSASAS